MADQVVQPQQSPFKHQPLKFITSVTLPQRDENCPDGTFKITVHDPDVISGPCTDIIGVASMYPVENAMSSVVYRSMQHFKQFQTICIALFPFCIIPPLPESETDVSVQARLLHLFIARLSSHYILQSSNLFHLLIYEQDTTLLESILNTLIKIEPSFASYDKFHSIAVKQSYLIPESNPAAQYIPHNVYQTIDKYAENGQLPSTYGPARNSVWNMCATTLEAAQGLRSAQTTSSNIGNTMNNTIISSSSSSSTSPSPSSTTSVISSSTTAPSGSIITNNTNSTTIGSSTLTGIDLGQDLLCDHRTAEDAQRVLHYLNALSTRLETLSSLIELYNKQQTILTQSLSHVGDSIDTWSMYETIHHEEIRNILDSLIVALLRPLAEITPQPVRTQLPEYMRDLVRQTECVTYVLSWRLNVAHSLSTIIRNITKEAHTLEQLERQYNVLPSKTPLINIITTSEGSSTIQQQQQQQHIPSSPDIPLAVSAQRLVLADNIHQRIKQQRYLDVINAYMMIALASWRALRKNEIHKCIRSYAVSQRAIAVQRQALWAQVDQDLIAASAESSQ